MNSNCGCPIALRAASVMAVVGVALVMAPASHANDYGVHMFGGWLLLVAIAAAIVACVVYAAVVALVASLALRAAARSARPRENKWAAWSLILGMVSPLVCLFGPFGLLGLGVGSFAIWTGIKAYSMRGSKWMAVPGIVLGAISTLYAVTSFL